MVRCSWKYRDGCIVAKVREVIVRFYFLYLYFDMYCFIVFIESLKELGHKFLIYLIRVVKDISALHKGQSKF